MIRRSIFTGIIAGLLLTLAGVYPVLSLFAPLVLPDWERPISNELAHGILLMISAVIALPTILGVGIVAAWRTNANDWKTGARVGGLAGGIAGLLSFFTLISPLNGMLAFSKLVPFLSANQDTFLIPVPSLVDYMAVFESGSLLLGVELFISILLGAVQGAWWGHRQTAVLPERPTLYGLISQGKHPREWFAGDETASRMGLWVGSAISVLTIVITLSWFYVGLTQDFVELREALEQSDLGIISGPIFPILRALSPILSVSMIGFGAVIVGLIKNPPDRFLSRIKAVTLASIIISVSMAAILLRILYFHVGLLPFYLFKGLQEAIPNEQFQLFHTALSVGEASILTVTTVLILPWLILFIALVFGSLFGVIQGLFYSLVIPLVAKRPIDKAESLLSRLNRNPTELLPQLYAYFNQEKEAHDVLVHLTILTHEGKPAVSRLAAAYHTLSSSDDIEEHLQALDGIQSVLGEHSNWRWAADFSAAHRSLHYILKARTVEQILKIPPPPEQQTTSLPPAVVKSVQHISRIINELYKVEKVEDLPTKLIFLENTLAAIHEAQRFTNNEMGAVTDGQVILPEHAAFAGALDHWQGVVLTAVKRLKGRADVVCYLKTKQYPLSTKLPLICQIANKGLNVAQKVHLKLLPGENYVPGENHENWIEILPPGESRQLTFPILPAANARRVRVAWEVSYDDAVDEDRHFSFGDVVEFTNPDKPFQRIFPIPYVTGTPLKTDDVFVGREDVFAFIKENLLGQHQNNVIILHGQRRTGKTSVLYRLGEVLTDTHYGVLIDMQGKPARGEADFLYAIADDIVFTLEEHGIEVELPPRKEFEESPEFYFRSRFLRSLYPHLNGKNLLLLFDEFEELQRRVEDGRLKPEIFQFLRNLMQHEEKVDFVFSGTHKLEELGAEYWSMLFNIAVYKPITFLSTAEMRRLMQEPIKQYNLEYDPLAVERIANITAGHPYFTQLVLHEMIVYHNETERSYFTVADVDQVLERIVERGEAHFKFIWAESTPEEREVLQGLTELLVSEETVNVKVLREFLNQCGCHSLDEWDKAIYSLEGRDILTRTSNKSQLYRFKVDLIRLWIDRTRPAL